MIDYNVDLLNRNDLSHSFFCLDRDDPTLGFEYDASSVFGPTYPPMLPPSSEADEELHLRLLLGSHLARHLRQELEIEKGYTSTVGIATNKVLAKLVGNVNKPMNQTTIMPPYNPVGHPKATVTQFLDGHDIGRIPGVGSKLAQKIRLQVLGRQPEVSGGLVYGSTRESVTVGDVRSYPGMGPELLEDILGGPGWSKGIGGKIWELINGVDETEVGKSKRIPSQISQEDSYMKYLHTFDEVKGQLHILGERLIRRMHMDLLEEEEGVTEAGPVRRRWMAHPRTIRLSTRPRPPAGPDGAPKRPFHRISRSGPMPNFVFSLNDTPTLLAERLVEETLVPMFRKLHHEKTGWNLSLINVAATNMAEAAAENKDSAGRDIGRMFRRQDDVLKNFRVIESDEVAEPPSVAPRSSAPKAPPASMTDAMVADGWDFEDSEGAAVERCEFCHNMIPSFALAAHRTYHELSN